MDKDHVRFLPYLIAVRRKKFQASGSKAPNYNTQITNKFQIPISNVQNVCDFEFWSLGFVCDLNIVICDLRNVILEKEELLINPTSVI
jgi:hypothetical protein